MLQNYQGNFVLKNRKKKLYELLNIGQSLEKSMFLRWNLMKQRFEELKNN